MGMAFFGGSLGGFFGQLPLLLIHEWGPSRKAQQRTARGPDKRIFYSKLRWSEAACTGQLPQPTHPGLASCHHGCSTGVSHGCFFRKWLVDKFAVRPARHLSLRISLPVSAHQAHKLTAEPVLQSAKCIGINYLFMVADSVGEQALGQGDLASPKCACSSLQLPGAYQLRPQRAQRRGLQATSAAHLHRPS